MKAQVLLAAFTAAIVLLAVTSTYSAYVTAMNHRNNCVSRDLTLDTLHDVVLDAFTPPPRAKLTGDQVKQIQALEARLFARIDLARC